MKKQKQTLPEKLRKARAECRKLRKRLSQLMSGGPDWSTVLKPGDHIDVDGGVDWFDTNIIKIDGDIATCPTALHKLPWNIGGPRTFIVNLRESKWKKLELSPKHILPSSLVVGDKIEWTSRRRGRSHGTIEKLTDNAKMYGASAQTDKEEWLYDDFAAKYDIRIIRRAGGL